MAEEPVEKPVMLLGIDDGEQSLYGLEWALQHFFTPYTPNYPFKLLLINAKPYPTSVVGLAGPGAAEFLRYGKLDEDLRKAAERVVVKAKEMCLAKGIEDVAVEVMEGDPRNVLCDAVEHHSASMLVVGSHGYGPMKRAVLGSVSNYCAHHAHCSVMIVKKPKSNRH